MKLANLLPLGLFILSMNAYAAKVEFTSPDPGDLAIDQTFVLNIAASEFQSGLIVVGGGFRLSFDESVLELTSFTPAAVWNLESGVDNGDYYFVTTTVFGPTAPRESFNVGTLTFKVIDYGSTDIDLSAPTDVHPWAAATSNGQYPNAAAIQYGSLSVVAPNPTAPVPVPAAVWLFGTGLLAFGSSLRRNRLA